MINYYLSLYTQALMVIRFIFYIQCVYNNWNSIIMFVVYTFELGLCSVTAISVLLIINCLYVGSLMLADRLHDYFYTLRNSFDYSL